jgi:hypothetical protein
VCWAAGQRSLPAEALTARVVELDEAFDPIYTDFEMIALRCYLRDVVATTVDGGDLRRVIRLRATAVPPPRDRRPEDRHLLASEPDQRAQILHQTTNSNGLTRFTGSAHGCGTTSPTNSPRQSRTTCSPKGPTDSCSATSRNCPSSTPATSPRSWPPPSRGSPLRKATSTTNGLTSQTTTDRPTCSSLPWRRWTDQD